MQCVADNYLEDAFDLDETEVAPDVDAFVSVFTFTEALTFDSTLYTYAVTVASSEAYNGAIWFAESPFGLASIFLYGRDGHTRRENITLAGLGRHYDYSYEVSDLTDAANVVAKLVKSGVNVDVLTIAGHGSEGMQYLGGDGIFPTSSAEKCPKKQTSLEKIGKSMSQSGIIQLLGCNVAGEDGSMNGPQYIQRIANESGRPIVAFTGKTWFTFWGSANFGNVVIRAPEIK